MNKNDRKRAIQAEIERRAASTGVPGELYVYKMGTHHSDEGGPRPYVPVKEIQSVDDDDSDDSLWPTLFRAAVQDGVPIELALDPTRIFRDGRTPIADICKWGDGDDFLLILTERANEALQPILQKSCRPVPVACAAAMVFGYHIALEDVLDVENCEAHWIGPGKKCCSDPTRYAIHTERLGRAIFRTPQNKSRVLVLQPVVDAAVEHKLTGFGYRRVWPHGSVAPLISIEVKKLPRSDKQKRRDPKLSTAANEVEPNFLDELLGSPLTHDGNIPLKVVAFELAKLSIPSGSIVAADLFLGEGKPFARRVKPGDYPITLVAARLTGNDERIAFAMIRLSDRRVAAWEVAAVEGTGGNRSRESENHGYAVDSGTGGFCDAAAQEVLLNLADPEGTLEKRIEKEMKKSYRHTRGWVHVETEAGSAAIFSSGFGDGQYPSYFGLDKAGEPVVLMTDFGVLDWSRRPQ